jgi:hypothetical protein
MLASNALSLVEYRNILRRIGERYRFLVLYCIVMSYLADLVYYVFPSSTLSRKLWTFPPCLRRWPCSRILSVQVSCSLRSGGALMQ